MFQTFEVRTSRAQGAAHLPLLRAELSKRELDGFLVPHEDAFQSEYVPPAYDRLSWLTGFTGSAGAAIVLQDKAAIFVDGRYTLQVRSQVDTGLFEPQDLKPKVLVDWLVSNTPKGGKIGFDPWLHTVDFVSNMQARLKAKGLDLIAVETNPVDAVWANRPAEPCAPVYPHSDALSGLGSTDKRKAVGQTCREAGATALVITSPSSIAWLLNIRGGDVAHTPLPFARAILETDGQMQLFLHPDKVTPGLAEHLGGAVDLFPPDKFLEALSSLGSKSVAVDPALTPAAIFNLLEASKAKIIRMSDPCAGPRAAKSVAEQSGTREAHLRDGVALTRFLHWLSGETQSGDLTEIKAAEALEGFRRQTNALKDVSFETISGSGPNGAIVHYRVTTQTNRKLEPGDLYLVDSGGQYEDGTTDVTRTVAIEQSTEEMRRAFTLVLKGHIALATAVFPVGTCGVHLDALARMSLWKAGLDYDHGTGHGVGSYLGVHEGPQNISKALKDVPLVPGMIISNEPGYYKTGAFGIRIENLILVREPTVPNGGDRPMMSFETLTLAPIDRELIVSSLLSVDERTWLNEYHARVCSALSPQLNDAERAWLKSATQPV